MSLSTINPNQDLLNLKNDKKPIKKVLQREKFLNNGMN
jgi:hypothetical protein